MLTYGISNVKWKISGLEDIFLIKKKQKTIWSNESMYLGMQILLQIK